ncbi:MAG: ATP-binding cassette domain-containing protein [Chloroflexi bacterium]|nr:ATP-binding cassette domain-containing protein [Chloroflexota bacterium]
MTTLAIPSFLAIEMQKVQKVFKNTAGTFLVLKGIDLSLSQGEFVAIVGKSGSGKSTLLNMITGIDHPSGGNVIVNGVNVHTMNESTRSLWRGNNLGIVFQFFQLLPMLTLQENVMLPMDFVNKYDFDERPKRALELLTMVGLEKQAYKLPLAVSTGQQQCAAIARALATDPPVIAADEPTGNLDTKSSDVIISLFDHLVRSGKTIVMVTHDPSLTERTSRTVVISDGELINETVAKCFVNLSHHQMLEFTHNLEYLDFAPGSTILAQDQSVDYLYLIVSGEVEISLLDKKGERLTITHLKPDQFFGEIELTGDGHSQANVSAGKASPVKLVGIRREKFLELLKDSQLTEEAIQNIGRLRLEENRSARQKLGR